MKITRPLCHGVHPMLIVLPVGLLASVVLFDLLYLMSRDATFALVAYWNITAGLAGGVLAALFGCREWLTVPENTRAKIVGLLYGAGNLALLALFGTSWAMRHASSGHVPSPAALALSFCAAAMAVIGGWLGSELIERLGPGVHEEEPLHSPEALSGERA